MSEINYGGPAFPNSVKVTNEFSELRGMTLRDYFAAKAMQGIMSANKAEYPGWVFAKRAYEIADEMLKARES